jgi:hypothetical protein
MISIFFLFKLRTEIMVSILLYIFRFIIIYYFGDDPIFGLNTYYMDESVHEEINVGSRTVLTGIGIIFLFAEFYYINL